MSAAKAAANAHAKGKSSPKASIGKPPNNGGAAAPRANAHPPARKPTTPVKPKAAPVPAAAPSTAAPAAAPSPTVEPFLTPEQQQALDDGLGKIDTTLQSMDYNYGQTAASTHLQAGDYTPGTNQLDNNGKIFAQGTNQAAHANNSLIARGLFQSSIRDTDLGDIDATTALRRTSALTALATLSAHNDQARTNLGNQRTTLVNNYNNQAVQNAQAVTPTPDPTPTPTPASSKPSAPVATKPVALPKPKLPAKPAVPKPKATPIPKPKAPTKPYNGGASAPPR